MLNINLKRIIVLVVAFSSFLSAQDDQYIHVTGTNTVSECRLTTPAKSFGLSFWAEGCPYPSRASL